MLDAAGLDPTAVIGGRVRGSGGDPAASGARLGRGDLLVAEADESDGSFLRLAPVVAVVTNVEPEHLDHWGSYEALLEGFAAFANRVPFFGAAVVGLDDAGRAPAPAPPDPAHRHLRLLGAGGLRRERGASPGLGHALPRAPREARASAR